LISQWENVKTLPLYFRNYTHAKTETKQNWTTYVFDGLGAGRLEQKWTTHLATAHVDTEANYNMP